MSASQGCDSLWHLSSLNLWRTELDLADSSCQNQPCCWLLAAFHGQGQRFYHQLSERASEQPEKGNMVSILLFLQSMSLQRRTSWALELDPLPGLSKQEAVRASFL